MATNSGIRGVIPGSNAFETAVSAVVAGRCPVKAQSGFDAMGRNKNDAGGGRRRNDRVSDPLSVLSPSPGSANLSPGERLRAKSDLIYSEPDEELDPIVLPITSPETMISTRRFF